MKDLLVVVDMVNGFVNFGALADKKINKIVPNIVKLIKDAKETGMDIVDFRDCHSLDDEELKYYPVHCLKGTPESENIPEIKEYENDMMVIEKDTTNGFKTEEFLNYIMIATLKRKEIKNIYVTGCCTDICVKDFVTSLMKFIKKYNLDINVYVVEDACYTFDGPDHNGEEMHENAIKEMEALGAIIIRVNENENEGGEDEKN